MARNRLGGYYSQNTRNIARRVSPCSRLGNLGRVDTGRRISARELE